MKQIRPITLRVAARSLLEAFIVALTTLGLFIIPNVLSFVAVCAVSLCTSRLTFDSDGFWLMVAAFGTVLLYFQLAVLRNTIANSAGK